jgi:hypothetical protein
MQILPIRNNEDKDQTLTSVNSSPVEGQKRSDLGESTSSQIRDYARSSDDTYRKDRETTVRELTRISCSLRDTTAIMPDVLRLVRQYGCSEDLVSAIDDLACAVHDTTVAIQQVTTELKV